LLCSWFASADDESATAWQASITVKTAGVCE
jgi:hypothetical protein